MTNRFSKEEMISFMQMAEQLKGAPFKDTQTIGHAVDLLLTHIKELYAQPVPSCTGGFHHLAVCDADDQEAYAQYGAGFLPLTSGARIEYAEASKVYCVVSVTWEIRKGPDGEESLHQMIHAAEEQPN